MLTPKIKITAATDRLRNFLEVCGLYLALNNTSVLQDTTKRDHYCVEVSLRFLAIFEGNLDNTLRGKFYGWRRCY